MHKIDTSQIFKGEQFEVKIVDFGFSRKVEKNNHMKTITGTPYYMAPEVLDGDYDSKCDTWSLGVLLYMLMSGYLPFNGEKHEIYNKIKNGDYHFNHEEFKQTSDEVKDLIKKLLTVNVNDRLSAQ